MASDEERIVAVVWEDAAFGLDDEPSVYVVNTVGYVTKENKVSITVAAERLESEDGYIMYRGRTVIPQRSILHTRTLEIGEAP